MSIKTKLTVQEVKEVNNEIDNIVLIKLKYNDLEIEVRHTLIFTMIDGKVYKT